MANAYRWLRVKTRPLRANDPWIVLTGRDPDARPTFGYFLLFLMFYAVSYTAFELLPWVPVAIVLVAIFAAYYVIGGAMVRRKRRHERQVG